MPAHETSHNDPFKVFTDGYWGEVTPIEPITTPLLANNSIKHFKQLLRTSASKIISGEQRGIEIPQGVAFNPFDKELSSLSCHWPGTVLLADMEVLAPVRDKFHYLEEVDNSFFTMSAREFIREQLANEEETQLWVPRSIGFHDGERAYYRSVCIWGIGQARSGRPSIGNVQTLVLYPGAHERDRAAICRDRMASRFRSVGEAYARGNPEDSDTFIIQRLRSLEVCVTGEPAREKSPSLARGFLGRLAISPH